MLCHAPPEPCLGTFVPVIIWCNSRSVNAPLPCCYACQEQHACMSQILAGVGSCQSIHYVLTSCRQQQDGAMR